MKSFADAILKIFKTHEQDCAILNYAIKVLTQKKMSGSTGEFLYKFIFHWVIIFPYLIPILDEYIFQKFNISEEVIAKLSQKIFDENIKAENYEGASYAIYSALKYKFKLDGIKFTKAKSSKDCIFMVFLYDKYHKNGEEFAEYYR